MLGRQLREHEKTELTRLAAVKQLFGAFVNRSIAYNYPAAVGLLPFSDAASVSILELQIILMTLTLVVRL
jgi:hypothetical protein